MWLLMAERGGGGGVFSMLQVNLLKLLCRLDKFILKHSYISWHLYARGKVVKRVNEQKHFLIMGKLKEKKERL